MCRASKLEETRILQQARATRVRGSDMSAEDVRLSSASGGDGEGEQIASLTTHFTGQRAKVNVLDTRLEEYIEREMAKRKSERVDHPDSASREAVSKEDAVAEEEKKEIEVDEDEEAEKRLHDLTTRPKTTESESNAHGEGASGIKAAHTSNVIDLSNATLRATSSTQSSSQTDTSTVKRHHRPDGPVTTAGILEIDLPVEEQLRMYEATRQAALEALRNQKRKRHTHHTRDEFGDLELLSGLAASSSGGGNVSADFSKRTFHSPSVDLLKRTLMPNAVSNRIPFTHTDKKHQHSSSGNRATDMDALDKYKKKQAAMHR